MPEIEYSGRDNLTVMDLAVNYNRYLQQLVLGLTAENDRILDFGAGNGGYADSIARLGYDVECVETDPLLSTEIKQKGLRVQNDLNAIDTGSINLIYSLNVLEHIENDQQILKNMYRILPQEGKLMLFVPAFQSLYSSMDKKVGHFRRYQKNELFNKVQAAGFHVKKICYADTLGYFASVVYKIMDKGDGSINPAMLSFYDKWVFPLSKLLDLLFGRFIGKNLYIYAEKRD